MRERILLLLGLGVTLAALVVPGIARAEDRRCSNVTFRSPYTHHVAQARVAVRAGQLSCRTARQVMHAAMSYDAQGTN
jgi:hypothetical protein